MEAGLATLVVLAVLVLRCEARRGSRADWLASVLIGFAPLVRPELVLFSGTMLLVELPALRRAGWRRLTGDIISLGVWGLAWCAFSIAVWGSPLPATAIAKGTLGASHITTLAAGGRVFAVLASTQSIAFLLMLSALWAWGRESEGQSERAPGRVHVVRAVALLTLAMVLVYALRHVNVYTRYVLPLGAAIAAVGMARAVSFMRASGPTWFRTVWIAALGLTLAQNVALSSVFVVPKTRAYARSMNGMVLPLAHWLRESTPKDAIVAVPNIGAIGLYSERRILDLNGLATPELVPFKREGRIGDYLAAHPPAVLIEIEATPRLWHASPPGELPLEELAVHEFDGMFVRGPEPMYWSVYRVRQPAEE